MTTQIPCPACYHSETMLARYECKERCADDMQLMHWEADTFNGSGHWVCDKCDTKLLPWQAAKLLDAALTAADPENNCDSFNGYTYDDCTRALKGGAP